MKKIIFEVSTKKEVSIMSLMKKVNKFPSRLQIDLEKGLVIVENLEDTMIDSIIELIDQYYAISSINIDNTSDEQRVFKK